MNEKIYDKALHEDIHQQESTDAQAHDTHPLGTELIKRFAKEVLQLIKEGLLRDGIVRIHNFGTFRLKMSSARTAYNPKTREPIKIGPRARVLFAPAKSLREQVEPNPKAVIPIAHTEETPRKPEPPKAENPIAVSLPTKNEPEQPEIDESPDDNDDIIANATFASMTQTPERQEQHLSSSLGSNIASTPFSDSDSDNSNDDEAETLQARDSQPSYENDISDFSTPSSTSHLDTLDSDYDQPLTREDVSNYYGARDDAGSDHISGNDDYSTAEVDEPFDPRTQNEPVDNSELWHSLHEEPNQADANTYTSNHIEYKENRSSLRAIGIVSILSLLLLIALLFWLLPLDEPIVTRQNPVVSTPSATDQQLPDTTVQDETAITSSESNLESSLVNEGDIIADEAIETTQSHEAIDTSIAVSEADPLETDIATTHAAETETIAQTDTNTITETETATDVATETESSLANTETTNTHTPEPFFSEKIHNVIFGDNLWKLATHNYINPFLWPHIYQNNSDVIKNPNILEVNNTITLPTLFGHPTKLTATDRRSIAEGYWLLYEHYKKTGTKNAHYALIGVKWFDAEVLEEHMDQIMRDDQNKLNAKRTDNRMIERAMMFGS